MPITSAQRQKVEAPISDLLTWWGSKSGAPAGLPGMALREISRGPCDRSNVLEPRASSVWF